MKYLTLILALASGETSRNAMPAYQCHAAAATMHHAWSVGGRVDRDDGAIIVGAECVPSLLEEIHAIESDGPCEIGETS